MKKTLIIVGLVIGLAFIIAACQPAPTCPEATPCPEAPAQPAPAEEANVPFMADWQASGHADAESPAFTHWNEENPQEIPTTCAKCHSGTGFADYVGADGSEAMKVDNAAAVGTVIACENCHSEAAASLSTVVFPSGVEITGLGKEAVCMTCHQGMASKVQVDQAVEGQDPDTVNAELGFTNIHYYAAAATVYAGEVMGGYQYEGKAYDSRNDHVAGYTTCVDCHSSHSLEVKVNECSHCHTDVKAVEDLKNVREPSSLQDYDGDGDTQEGMFYEIEGMQAALYGTIQAYAKDVAKAPVVYTKDVYPYFFGDTNADGVTDEAEAVYANAYKSWTPRLLEAAYNYQLSIKDPGAFAHGNKYIVQLLFDSMEDLNTVLPTPVDMSAMHRDDSGHFAGNSEAFRHWDEEGKVEAACVKCHQAEGIPQFIENGTNIAMPASNGFACTTCHNAEAFPALYEVANVTFPSGAVLTFGEGDPNNLCMMCHQGRESSVSVAKSVAGLDPDTASDKVRFRNVHYFAAGSTLFGTEAKGVYEYEGQTYAGRFLHVEGYQTCSSCHDVHKLEPKVAACTGCHQVDDPEKIRMEQVDYDGDGDVTEGIYGEVETMKEKLYAAIQAYAKDKLGTGILYDGNAYPYFYLDADNDGNPDKNDQGGAISFNAWSPRLLFAGYNLQYAMKDPGAFVHNPTYVMQVLYDSIKDLGGSVAGMTRPE